MEKINKVKARKAFNEGKTVTIIPCNMRVGGMWVSGFPISKTESKDSGGESRTFEDLVSEMEHYNCNHETGYYAAYYL